MQIPKAQILDLLRGQGDHDQADRELPDQVDTDQHKGPLDKFGIDPNNLGGLGELADKIGL